MKLIHFLRPHFTPVQDEPLNHKRNMRAAYISFQSVQNILHMQPIVKQALIEHTFLPVP